jgi:hypothetical protein
MAQQVSSAKSLRIRKPTKSSHPPLCCGQLAPCCGQLAEQFIELQLLRQKVAAAECETPVRDQKVSSGV